MKMKNEKRQRLKLTVFCATFLLLTAVLSFLPTKEEAEIYNDVIRLRVIAASDSEFDTAVKLLVRDAVLSEISVIYGEQPAFSGSAPERCATAENLLCSNIDKIRSAAETSAAHLNVTGVSVSLSEDRFPEKTYGDITLPAGYYRSLTVKIGEAEGHNWWCVVYPTICMSPASPAVTLRETGFSKGQIDVLQGNGGYTVKFKLLELLQDLFGR